MASLPRTIPLAVASVGLALLGGCGRTQISAHQPDTSTTEPADASESGWLPRHDGMATVPEGMFLMGSPDDEPSRYGDESQHAVTLTRSFFIDLTEVTQGEFARLMGNNPSYHHACGEACPVDSATWTEAAAYANARSIEHGLAPCYELGDAGVSATSLSGSVYDCEGYRLPTEAEWEYAARAGTTTAYPTGIDDTAIGTIAWFDDNAEGGPHPVGQRSPNAWGIYDMMGNVNEWCWDAHTWFDDAPATDPEWNTSAFRVARGGTWFSWSHMLRSAARISTAEDTRHPHLGFRLVRTAP